MLTEKVIHRGGNTLKRNPLIPFLLIMVLGIGLIFFLSFKGLDDAKDLAKEKEGGAKTEETAKASPEDTYKSTCLGCHGGNYEGGVGPALKGTGLSAEEIKEVLVNGKGSMPGGLVAGQEDAMAEFISGL